MLRRILIGILCLTWFGATLSAQNPADEFDPPDRNHRTRPREGREPISLDGGASINPRVLRSVEDETIGLTEDDREPYYRILKLTQKLPAEDLQLFAREFREDRHAASPRYSRRPIEKFPTYVDLFQHPNDYRGRPVTLHGYFRSLIRYEAGRNKQELQTLYEGWLYLPDYPPAVVVFTELPEGLHLGSDIAEEVTVTGYFLKMYGYRAHDTTRKAPMILSHSVNWIPPRKMERWTPSPFVYSAVTGGIIVLGLLIWIGVLKAQHRHRVEWHQRHPDVEVFVPPGSTGGHSPPLPGSNGMPLEPHH